MINKQAIIHEWYPRALKDTGFTDNQIIKAEDTQKVIEYLLDCGLKVGLNYYEDKLIIMVDTQWFSQR